MRPVIVLQKLKQPQSVAEFVPHSNETHSCKVENNPKSDPEDCTEDDKEEAEFVEVEDLEIKNEVSGDEFHYDISDFCSNDSYEQEKDNNKEEVPEYLTSSQNESCKTDDATCQEESVARVVLPKSPPVPVKSHSCSQCDLTFTRRYNIFRHIEDVHEKEDSEDEEEEPQRRFKCPLCPKPYFKAPKLWRHKIIKHPEIMQRPCSSCPEVFDRDLTLLEHRKKAHNYIPPPLLSKSLQCSICSRIFSKPETCRQHVASVHEKIPAKKNTCQCPHCPFSCRQVSWLRRNFYLVHPEIHLKKKPRPCLVCFHTFRSEVELESHMERHASLKCPTFAKYLPTTVHLRKYLKVHQQWKTK